MYSFSLSSICTHTHAYICVYISIHTQSQIMCIHTHTYKIAPITGLLTSAERSFYQHLCCKENLCHFWHLLATWKVSVYRLVNKYGKKFPCTGMIFFKATVQEKRPWDHQVSDVSFYRLPFPLLLALWFHIHCCMVSSSHLTA